MKQDPNWKKVSTGYKPLSLYSLIEKTILTQSETQYPFATVYAQEQAFYAFRQETTMSNTPWYKRFNTKLDVGTASVSRINTRVYWNKWLWSCTKPRSSLSQPPTNKTSVKKQRSDTHPWLSYYKVALNTPN
jgi:hypothetical protein